MSAAVSIESTSVGGMVEGIEWLMWDGSRKKRCQNLGTFCVYISEKCEIKVSDKVTERHEINCLQLSLLIVTVNLCLTCANSSILYVSMGSWC